MTREPEKFHMARVDVEAASCTAAKSRYSITSSARMEAGDKVISPLPVALVEGRRRAHWYRPGTTDSHQSPDPSRDRDGVFGTHRSKKCRKRLLFGVIYLYQTFKTTSLENIPYGPFGVANLELATFSL